MYYSKLPQYDQNMNPNLNSQPEQNIYTQLQDSQLTLNKALENIESLQQNLGFMLCLNTKLKEQNQRLRQNQQHNTRATNKIISEHEKTIMEVKVQNQEIAQLLQQTKKQLLDISTQLKTSQDDLARSQTIIRQQKKAYVNLQLKFMNTSVSYIGDNTSLIQKQDYQYITQLEKQNNQMQTSLKRLQQMLQKQKNRNLKLQKQSVQFKQWMGSILGINKVLEGSEKILMNQIAQRVISA